MQMGWGRGAKNQAGGWRRGVEEGAGVLMDNVVQSLVWRVGGQGVINKTLNTVLAALARHDQHETSVLGVWG